MGVRSPATPAVRRVIMLKLSRLSARSRFILNILVTIASLLLCTFLSLMRLPGMEILGIAPNWLLIWLVSWSLNRSCLDSVVAGLAIGAIQDSLTSNYPSHIMVFGLIGFLTSRLHRQRYVKEELIAVVLIVFVMTLIADGAIAFQYYLQGGKNLADLWFDYQRIGLTSALLSSLWTPLLYYPLQQWWRQFSDL
ncbi:MULTISPECIES: rod shape-determining protein MreD [Microcystis]|uniref:Rod shape-determining protein MreD n=5 Tax=Microcystis aeruginosa TaxID=1126 RepID=S3J6M1_MICAE|nr:MULTISPECIES: rod shape-determining protein MreD [Microcystis]NCR99224.1 rod shape-determining protein MreD [Microcystis aeruginosa L311-01]OCY15340.1 MAG: rod shape-determining protein MreD [Microcystis aeruginosa CACIAM 03]REJ53887.1 MAG: rod shape-determining protein MreD [Microcystis aeruginosa DA14]TRU10548.1 MAG: rod shape-determining protein MreD [Microcystis aeruginosa Ma_MB_F_20061100_S19D]TRU16465.1 MAG: rod shape-determining protein MreD [Microcystis aeruginosa Ma_MB_F_20061100_S